MRKNCTPGSVRGAPGNRRSYRGGIKRGTMATARSKGVARKMTPSRRRIPWVGAIGAFLIFCSWFVQNKYSSELAEARRNLDGSITNIGLAASAAEDWTMR